MFLLRCCNEAHIARLLLRRFEGFRSVQGTAQPFEVVSSDDSLQPWPVVPPELKLNSDPRAGPSKRLERRVQKCT